MSSVAEKLQRKNPRGGGKQVRLKLVYLDFWSVVKLAFIITVALGIVTVVASLLLWMLLSATVFDSIDGVLSELLDGFSLAQVLSLPNVMVFALIIALLNIVVGTALSAIAAALYNISVRFTGGLLVGFANHS